MVTDPRFENQSTPAEAPPREKSGCSSCMTGCGVVALILVILLVIAGLLFWVYGKGWIANAMSTGLAALIEETALPAEEKQQMKEQVNRVTDAFKGDQLSWGELGQLIQQITNSPVMSTLVVSAVEKKYLNSSGLNDEEKEAGRQTLRRFVRGVIDQKINDQQVDAAMAHVADRQADGQWKLRQQVSDEDVRKFLAAAKDAADKAEIPEEPEAIDPSDELKRIIDGALNQ